MQLLNIINDADAESFTSIFDKTIEDPSYTSLSWAVSDYNDATVDEYFLPNAERFKHLYLSGEWNCSLSYRTQKRQESIKYWRETTPYAKHVLGTYKNVVFIRAKNAFHPKVYLFYNDDHSRWKAYIGSLTLTISNFNTIESVAVLTQDDDDKEGTLFNSILKMFTESIPLSENICGNYYTRKRAEKENREKQIQDHEIAINEVFATLSDKLSPFVGNGLTKRRFEIFSKYIRGRSRKELANEYQISEERIRQICDVKKLSLHSVIRNMVKYESKEYVEEVKRILISIERDSLFQEMAEKPLKLKREEFTKRINELLAKAYDRPCGQ